MSPAVHAPVLPPLADGIERLRATAPTASHAAALAAVIGMRWQTRVTANDAAQGNGAGLRLDSPAGDDALQADWVEAWLAAWVAAATSSRKHLA